jgi:hypothetical protein
MYSSDCGASTIHKKGTQFAFHFVFKTQYKHDKYGYYFLSYELDAILLSFSILFCL